MYVRDVINFCLYLHACISYSLSSCGSTTRNANFSMKSIGLTAHLIAPWRHTLRLMVVGFIASGDIYNHTRLCIEPDWAWVPSNANLPLHDSMHTCTHTRMLSTTSISNCSSFDFFYFKFDHSSYLKNLK